MVRELVEMHGFNLSVLTDKWAGRRLRCSETCCSALSVCLMDPESTMEAKKKKTDMEGRTETCRMIFTVVLRLAVK